MINKKRAISQMNEYGDFILDRFNNESICGTLDFSNKYIKSIRRYQRFQFKGNILLFNWTDNKFEAIPIKEIKAITPLSKILNNKRESQNGQ